MICCAKRSRILAGEPLHHAAPAFLILEIDMGQRALIGAL
jgi:hypothetical protein